MVATPLKSYSFAEYCQYDDGTDTRYELEQCILIPINPPIGLHFLIAQRLEKFLINTIQRQQKK